MASRFSPSGTSSQFVVFDELAAGYEPEVAYLTLHPQRLRTLFIARFTHLIIASEFARLNFIKIDASGNVFADRYLNAVSVRIPSDISEEL